MSEQAHFKDGPPIPMIYMWEGKDIEKLGRDELLEAFKKLADLYKTEMECNASMRGASAQQLKELFSA